jgi:hypothetical protein
MASALHLVSARDAGAADPERAGILGLALVSGTPALAIDLLSSVLQLSRINMSIFEPPLPTSGEGKILSLWGKVKMAAPARKSGSVVSEARRVWAAEGHFVKALRLEQKRAERSGLPFLLMLLEGAAIFGRNSGSSLFAVTAAVEGVIREGDLCGWYRQNHTLGVIFTEVNPAEVDSTIEALKAKVEGAVRGCLKPEDVERTEISLHLFPEARNGDGSQAGAARSRRATDRLASRSRPILMPTAPQSKGRTFPL